MLHGYTLRRVIFAIVRRVGQQRERLLTDAAYARPCVAGAVVTLVVLIVINGAGGGEDTLFPYTTLFRSRKSVV